MEATTKHTPGPWALCCGGKCCVLAIYAGNRTIGRFAPTHDEMQDAKPSEITEEDRANARLAAAAPELLTALKAAYPLLLLCSDMGSEYVNAMVAAEAAIAKAAPK